MAEENITLTIQALEARLQVQSFLFFYFKELQHLADSCSRYCINLLLKKCLETLCKCASVGKEAKILTCFINVYYVLSFLVFTPVSAEHKYWDNQMKE